MKSDKKEAIIVDGYVRLSRDDNKKNYSSIENQKLIIQEYAEKNNMIVRTIYEDDNFSGYSFNRPSFQKIIDNLSNISVIIAKDLSRIGRHNAKVLLFLEQMEELGKRIILIDDNYDSSYEDNDDIIGIKTWDNERHVKNTSRKVKRIKRMEQEKGTLICLPAFGYIRHPINKQLVDVDEEAAPIIRLIFDMYLDGYGIRKLSEELTRRGIPTPSMLQKSRCEKSGVQFKRTLATKWSFSMIKDIITNDYYIGVKRTHKRERKKINGTDLKVKKEEQFVFPNHHKAIIDEYTFKLVQETLEKRKTSNFRGQKKHINLFSGILFCADCGLRLTSINRKKKNKFYVCGNYNKNGKQFCEHSHMIYETVLIEAILKYLRLCSNNLENTLKNFDIDNLKCNKFEPNDSKDYLQNELISLKKELQVLISQKIYEITYNPYMKDIIFETYNSLEQQKLERIATIKKTLSDLTDKHSLTPNSINPCLHTALDILNEVINKQTLTIKDIEILVERIIVYKDGCFDIYLKHGLGETSSI